MLKNSKRVQIDDDRNILYLHENDAKALGIIEGGVQRVFVDGREVDVTFVDEHEIIPMTDDERKVYEEAERLANKYIAEARSLKEKGKSDSQILDEFSNRENEERRKSTKDFFSKFWLSNKKTEVDYDEIGEESKRERQLRLKAQAEEEIRLREEMQRSKADFEKRQIQREETLTSRELRAIKKQQRLERKRIEDEKRQEAANRKHRFSVRSDIFTEEELEILQGIISKSKGIDAEASTTSARNQQNRKKSKVKTTKKRR